MRFSVGVNYWPRSSGTLFGERFDPGEVRADFARMAELDLDAVRFFVQWRDLVLPTGAADPEQLDRIARVVTLAHDAGLRTMPAFCGTPRGTGDLYAGRALDAQLVLARAAGERLRAHPAMVAWDIGHAFTEAAPPPRGTITSGEHASEPAAERTVAEWSRRLSGALENASALPATAGISSTDITRDTSIRLASLCAPLAFASLQATNLTAAFARNRLDPETVPFLAMLAAAFSFKPVLVTGVGNPTCPAGKFSAFERFALPGEPPNLTISADDTAFATYPCLSEDENAVYCTAVLDRLHADGRLGAYWWCWADDAGFALDAPPFPGTPPVGTFGIVRSDGSAKPVAAALTAFARQERSIVPAREMPMISSTYYYRTLPVSTQTLYDAYLSFVEERRARPR